MTFAPALLVALSMSAAPSLDKEQLRPHLQTYFHGERGAGLPFIGAGAATVLTGSLLLGLTQTNPNNGIARGAAWPLIGLGAIELIAGALLAFGTNGRLAKLEQLLDEDPKTFKALETQRVERIRGTFQPILFAVWAATTVAGGAMATIGGLRGNDTLAGAGLGLAVQGIIFFILDWAVLDRANGYATALAQFTP